MQAIPKKMVSAIFYGWESQGANFVTERRSQNILEMLLHTDDILRWTLMLDIKGIQFYK